MSSKHVFLSFITLLLVVALVSPVLPSSVQAQDGPKYNEAPALAEQVAAGKLPPIAEFPVR